jgi:sugar phosphate isomerase/epimerase
MKNLLFLHIFFCSFSLTGFSQTFKPQFFCFEDAFLQVHSDDPVFQTKLLKKLGFDGMELMGLDRIEEKLGAIEQQNLRLFMVYIAVHLDKPEHFDPRLFDFIRSVKGKGVTLWLHILSDKLKPSDAAGDEICVPIIQEIADFAARYGVELALYPHTYFWLEKLDDSVRLTQKINRPNVGAVFNLCHYLKVDEKDQLGEKLISAIPFLKAVSINGADDGATHQMEWDRLIQPLGMGTYDVLSVLKILKANNYRGPVGLQCYAIPGKPEEFLKTSAENWQKYLKAINAKE